MAKLCTRALFLKLRRRLRVRLQIEMADDFDTVKIDFYALGIQRTLPGRIAGEADGARDVRKVAQGTILYLVGPDARGCVSH
jgi:hypothetical protein